MRHYLDEDTGDLPDRLPTPVLNLALFFGSIVAWVTDHLPHGDWHTNVPCRRSPGRRRCQGDIMAELDRTSGHIVWQCPVCGDIGLIQGWEGTLWNRQGAADSAGVFSARPTMMGSPVAVFFTEYRTVRSRSLIVPVCMAVSAACACWVPSQLEEPDRHTGRTRAERRPVEAVALCSGCDQVLLAQPAKPVHRCDVTAVHRVATGWRGAVQAEDERLLDS
jgi:hypothetical protein